MRVVLLSGIQLALGEHESALGIKVAEVFKINQDDIEELVIIRKSIDARRNKPPHFVYVLKVSFVKNVNVSDILPDGMHVFPFQEEKTMPSWIPTHQPRLPVIVIGSGPAGLFAAYVLALRGIHSIVVERGEPLERRAKDVEAFWHKGILDLQSNVYFGEGGAGTFSDGKLTSRSKNPYASWVKKIMVEAGAPPEILVDAKPHVGTDRLRNVIINLRRKLTEMGCRIEFKKHVTDFLTGNQHIHAVVINDREEMKTDHVILAIGQNADDTYTKLFERGAQMEAKPFAMGVRVEHPQALINTFQYGKWSRHPQLPPAEYFIKAFWPAFNRSIYTFCMCPGGNVIGCASQAGSLITNGMSHYRRSGDFADSAIVVNVRTDDFSSGKNPLDGLGFRKIWEQKAFEAGGGGYQAPAQRITDFLNGKVSRRLGATSFLPGVRSADLQAILPSFVADALKYGIRTFNKKMFGFVTQEAHVFGVETRTSSPVRICRGTDGQNPTIRGIYPCGEGAGYAGGIISSAVDGIKAAQSLMHDLNEHTF